ncbi:glycosyltransferase [Bacillus haikouensis]|uniref:glycosyltransferase n=1 Tax=Bacillus haikouensis TaxID=1510468 RepID=UPI0015549A4A|nr:glycosyltransferase [Bacillus haikouensis]NQD64947.1 glycosyltransferase [Bacillus haikouensis]
MLPKISVIIPFYNCSYVGQAIKSAIEQTYPNFDIILVDDGSTENIEKITPFLNRIIYLRKPNGGTATAVNWGIDHSNADYIAWLSSDDLMLKDKLSLQLEDMMRHGADLSFTDYDIIDQHNNVLLRNVNYKFTNDKQIYQEIFERNPINGSTVLIKKAVFEKAGYFNPSFKYTQDYDMWLRMVVRKDKLHYFDRVLTLYRSHPKTGTSNNQKAMKEEISNLRSFYRRYRK